MFWNRGVWFKSLLQTIFPLSCLGALSFQEARMSEVCGCYKTAGASEGDP